MILELPDINKFLILAPHPDDESMGCSGTAIILNSKGASSAIVFITNGEKLYGEPSEIIAEKRIMEAHRSCNLIGCKKNIFLNIPDGEVSVNEALTYKKIAEVIDQIKPNIIFCPSPLDHHHDHIATSRVSLMLHKNLRTFRLVFYEIYSTVRFSHLIDITGVIERKKDVIMNYHESLYGKPEVYVHASLGLNAQRSIFTQKKGYYEAFYIIEEPLANDDLLEWLTYGSSTNLKLNPISNLK